MASVVEQFLALARTTIKAPVTYKELAQTCKAFPFAGTDATAINENTVEDYFMHLNGLALQPNSKKKRFGFFKRFVRYCAAKRICPIPLNLDSHEWRFGGGAKKIKTYTVSVSASK